MKGLEEYVRSIPDFPEPGVIFRGTTSILQDTDELHTAVDSLTDIVEDLDYDLIIGPGSRGFIFGVSAVYTQCKGFVPMCKEGKLPCEIASMEYDLEYGQATIETRGGAIHPGQKVIIVDDLIATGGTTEAVVKLIKQLGRQVVKICFVMGLVGPKGREYLKGYGVDSAVIYEGKQENEIDLAIERAH